MTISEIPPIRRAALAAVNKNARVALVCGEPETLADLLHRLNAALGNAAAENIEIEEAMIRTVPPQQSRLSTSIEMTRFTRCAQPIADPRIVLLTVPVFARSLRPGAIRVVSR